MEIGVPNSFIPHDTTTPTGSSRGGGGGLIDLLLLVAIVLFVASCVLAAGSFLYLQYLNNQSAQDQNEIKAAQAAFDPTLIQQLTRLDERMNSANTLLAAHIAPSAFFAALDQMTLSTVSFQSLSFNAANSKGVSLQMSGIARDINSVALQADLFGKSGIITDAIFSGIDQQADGVHFSVSGSVNPSAINYGTLVTGQTPAGVNQLPAGSSTAPSVQQSSGPAGSSQQSQTAPAPFTGTPSPKSASSSTP
jgi:Tfp pilus assembly protein PilN